MSDYIEPTKVEFTNAEEVLIDVLNQNAPTVMTKTGSVVRELVIRPIAYLYAWATSNIANTIYKASVEYLSTSQLTDNPVADAVASNYFVTRNEGTGAKGLITLTLNRNFLSIAKGSSFDVAGTVVVTPDAYIAASEIPADVLDGVVYLQCVALGTQYVVNVPVVATTVGALEIPAGAEVTVKFPSSVIQGAQLTSAITGGSDTETDASMMRRAEYNTASSGIGTYYGLLKKLNKAPVTVYGLSVLAGEDSPVFRARYNNLNINPGGFVDCYVRTAIQPAVISKSITCTLNDGKYEASISDTDIAGAFAVKSILVAGSYVNSFEVSFEASDDYNTAEGARLSVAQIINISFDESDTDGSGATIQASVTLIYIPNIATLQTYMDSDSECFIGQNIQVKASVPVTVGVTCALDYADATVTDVVLNNLKKAISDYINSLEVGTSIINFSDIQKACQSVDAKASLRLPCCFTASTYTKNGTVYSYYSDTGILDISNSANAGVWDSSVSFFTTTTFNIRIEAT